MKVLQLNHVALHVADVSASVRFYSDVLKLEVIPRPAFSFPGAWFRLGVDQELHLIGERGEPVYSHNRGNHYALLIDDIDEWENYFRESGVPYRRQQRPDGAYQVYVTDPDGHVIELCTPPAPSA